MSKLISSLIILCTLSSWVSAQNGKPPCLSTDNLLLNQAKPTVYITFERSIKDKPLNGGESGDYVLLRLHNNTRWAITTYAEGLGVTLEDKSKSQDQRKLFTSLALCGKTRTVLRDGAEIDADYYVQAKAGSGVKAPEILRHDPFSLEVWLAPGSSLLFRVAREHLESDWNIYVPFRYEWEKDVEGKRPRPKSLYDLDWVEEPRHFVYFDYYRLPETSR